MRSVRGTTVGHTFLRLILHGLFSSALFLPTSIVPRSEAVAPELPRVFLDTTLVAPTGQTIAVPAGGSFQAALNAAQPGDVITLQAGATYQGPFTLPNKAGTGWITIRTSAPDSSLPAPGTRVTPAHATVMPKITVGAGVGGAIQTATGAHHFRFIGVEVRPVGANVWALVELGNGGESSLASQPHNIVIDRCYIHGNPGVATVRGVALNGRSLAVIDSHLAEFKDNNFDTQAIIGWSGAGPFKIVNNYLEAAGENVMFGGGDPTIANLVPSDIEIRHNYFFKPTSWRGVWAAVKNLFELKNARRVLVEGNIFENNWLAAQSGWAIQFTVRNQDGAAPWSTIEDVTFQRNIVRHAGSGLNILAADDPNPSQTMKRVLIRDNVFDDISGTRWGGLGRLFQILGWAGGSIDLVIEHNTAFQQENVSYADGLSHTRFIYRNNLSPRGAGSGFFGSGSSEGVSTLNEYFPSSEFRRNVLAGANAAIYPADNFFPGSIDAAAFVNRTAGDYRLAAGSPYKNAATDGTDIGADIEAVETETAGVITGVSDPGEPPPGPPPAVLAVAPGTAVDFGSVALGLSATRTFSVSNTGGTTLTGTVSTAAPFSVTSGGSFSLAAGASAHVVTVRFTPLTAIAFAGSVTFSSNGGNASRGATGTGTLPPDTTPPTVSITAPGSGSTVVGNVTVSATASDNIGVVGVQFKLDGVNLGAEDTSSPYSFAWNTTTASNSTHTLSAVARDAAGNTVTSSAVTVTVANPLPPALSVTPTATVAFGSTTVGLSVDQSFTVSNTGGSSLEGTVTTSAPFSVASGGSFTLAAGANQTVTVRYTPTSAIASTGTVSFSSNGGNASRTVTGTGTPPPDTTAPTVSISAPGAGSTLVGTVTVSAAASDNVGVVGVQFKLDGANLGAEDTSSPYSVAWSTTTASNSTHTLSAVARDAAGNTVTSASVSVTVSNPVPAVLSVAPAATVAFGSLTVGLSTDQSFTVTNTGGGTLSGTVSTSEPFSIVSAGTFSVAAGASQAVTVRFTPTSAISSTGSVSFTSNGGNASRAVTGTGTPALDNTPPTVSITAPGSEAFAAASTVATILVSASASDNVGVVGVQFKLDGANLGAEDRTAPYSVAWNTTTAPNGAHTLIAVARDAAGNTATSAAVTVTVSNPTPPPSPSRSPYRGVPFAVPGAIQAEDFDNGGEGITWHDLTPGNQGGFYRVNTDVDIIRPKGNATGAIVNNFRTGEWLEYTINVAQTGKYRIDAHVSSEFSNSRWHVAIDGINVTGSVAVPHTGSWRNFMWVGVGGITLTAGQHVLRIYVEQEYFDLNALRVRRR